MQTRSLDDDVATSSDEQLNIRIAWYYYITDMTQQQIADRFGITRVRVNKALATSRETGVVRSGSIPSWPPASSWNTSWNSSTACRG